jgi:putative salt-induced outer membrane protein YdiY
MKTARYWVGVFVGLRLLVFPGFADQAPADESPVTFEEAAPGETIEIPVRRPPWTGRFDLGFSWQEGRADKSEVSLRAQADRRIEPDEFRLLSEFLYGELDGVRNTQRFTGSFRWRRDINDRVFTQALTQYETDRIREIRNRVEQNLGVGYRFVQTERLQGSVVPGLTIQYTDEAEVEDRWDYLASLFQDIIWRISPAYRFEQDLNFLIDPAETEDYIVRFNAGIFGTVTDSINLSLRYQYLFENQVRAGISRTDQRVIASVGYAF